MKRSKGHTKFSICSIGVKRQGLFVCLSLFVLACRISSADATLYWEDDFEIPLTQGGRWAYAEYACSGSPCTYLDISTDIAHSGTHSLKLFYDTVQYNDSHNVGIIRTIPQTDPQLFTRFFYRTHNFTYSAGGNTNHFYLGNLGAVAIHSGSRAMALALLSSQDCYAPGLIVDCYASWHATPNLATINLSDDQWYCIETETTMNTLGSANAILHLWVNGVLTLEYKNFRIRGTSTRGPNGNSSLSAFNTIQIFKQAGSGFMYFDQFAVGTTRIGCGDNTSPPAAPNNLTVR